MRLEAQHGFSEGVVRGMAAKKWTEKRLQKLVNDGVRESTELEYKDSRDIDGSEGKRTGISKVVSAMANSAGGTIIYGIAGKDKPTGIDSGVDPGKYDKEWLENVITSNIRPKIEGLRIHPVDLTTKGPPRVGYVVEVPEGHTAHQARDKRYYRRRNFQVEAMEDYEIRLVMNKLTHPRLSCALRPGGGSRRSLPSQGLSKCVHVDTRLDAHVTNVGSVVAREIFAEFDIPEAYLKGGGLASRSWHMPVDTSIGRVWRVQYYHRNEEGQFGLWPGTTTILPDPRREHFGIEYDGPVAGLRRPMRARVFADNAPATTAEVTLLDLAEQIDGGSAA